MSRMLHAIWGAAALCVGCGEVTIPYEPVLRPSYDDVQFSCDLDSGVVESSIDVVRVSEICAETLGDAFSIDWYSFEDTTPHAFDEAVTPIELTLGGLLLTISPYQLSVADVLDYGPPDALNEEFLARIDEEALDPDDSAGELWFVFLQEWIGEIVYVPSDTVYARRSGRTIKISDVSGQSTLGWDLNIYQIGGLLVHEAGHGFLHGHVDCPVSDTGGCDVDANGTRGAEAWFLWSWQIDSADLLDDDASEDATDWRKRICNAVSADAWPNFLPCQEFY